MLNGNRESDANTLFVLQSGDGSPSIEQQAIFAAAISDTERFSGISNLGMNTMVDEKAAEHPSASVGDKVGDFGSLNILLLQLFSLAI